MKEPLEPLRFERHFVEKVWGGRALATRPGIELPPDVPIGETWEIVDRGEENSVVALGAFQGRTLRELMEERASEILGTARPAKGGRFPLLVKYIDATQDLSVQVHPDDDAAASIGGDAEAKTEAWYVLDSAAGGCVYAGLDPTVERDEFESIADGPGVVDALQRFEVEAGDCVLVRGGTVHAIAAGVSILEVQQNSDTTYRLYDWGRVGLDGKPRETHVRRALASVRFGEDVRPRRPEWRPSEEEGEGALERAELARSDVFGMDGLRITAAVTMPADTVCHIYSVVRGSGRLSLGSSERSWPLATGDVWLVPAACGAARLEPAGGTLEVVDMYPR